LYNVKIKKNSRKTVDLFINAFKDSKFETSNIYAGQMKMILSYSTELFTDF